MLFASAVFLILPGCEKTDNRLPYDADGNFYDTVVIGTQTWLAKNLRTTKFINGKMIPNVRDGEAWRALSTPGWCWFDNHEAFKDTYGVLYNWNAVNESNLCPEGYHVPVVDEWNTLITYLGGQYKAGLKLKEAGTDHWMGPNEGANNSTGFTALGAGQRNRDGSFVAFGEYGKWWTSTSVTGSENLAYSVSLYSNSTLMSIGSFEKQAGYSVRCIRDQD